MICPSLMRGINFNSIILCTNSAWLTRTWGLGGLLARALFLNSISLTMDRTRSSTWNDRQLIWFLIRDYSIHLDILLIVLIQSQCSCLHALPHRLHSLSIKTLLFWASFCKYVADFSPNLTPSWARGPSSKDLLSVCPDSASNYLPS